MKNRRIAPLLALLLSAALAGCSAGTENAPQSSLSAREPESVVSSEPVSSEPEVSPVCNPLTGEPGYSEELLLRRPVAVMVNNVKASMPQRGISKAELVFELPVEGAITRLMAVYSDCSAVPEVGSVRSARHDFVELAASLDAVYVHFGWSPSGKEAIGKYGIDNLNGLTLSKTVFHFDEARHQSKATEHCWFTSGQLIQAGVDRQGYSLARETPMEPVFHFAGPDAARTGTFDAAKVTAPLSSAVTAGFAYEPETGLYRKSQYGGPHLDETTGKAVAVKNVFLLYTDVGLMADGVHKEVNLSKGKGWYLSGGKGEEITFEKPGVTDKLKFYNAQGEELTVTPGSSWICIAPSGFQAKAAF